MYNAAFIILTEISDFRNISMWSIYFEFLKQVNLNAFIMLEHLFCEIIHRIITLLSIMLISIVT